jgi:hypothetical protein
VKFSEAYDLANTVWSFFVEWDVDDEYNPFLDPNDTEVAARLAKPHRDTLLHLFLRRFYEQNYVRGFEEHRNDMLDLVVNEYETILRFNDVAFKERQFPSEADPAYEKKALRRIEYLRRLLPLQRIAQDTFQLLFRDRLFLLRFNESIDSACGPRSQQSQGKRGGGAARARVTLPAWLKRGVFYRDNGRCVTCGKDLTGVPVTGEAVHYDHILPLASGGSNDPTNFQLLCASCNLRKAVKAHTAERYPVFWSLDN